MVGSYKRQFVQGPQKLKDGSRKVIHPGKIDESFASSPFHKCDIYKHACMEVHSAVR
jgi:hypothetical protein